MSLSSRWLCPHILFTACTLFLLPDRGLTFVPVIQQSSTSMFRRHNGGKALLPIIKASDNNNGRAWEKYFRLMGTSPSDDLTTQIAKSQSPTSAMSEEDFGKTAAITQNQRSFSLSALEHPSLELGRFLVLLASCIYGTNFSIVKLLDDTMPLSISATLRFGLAALVVSSVVLRKESDDVDPVVNKERNRAFWGGFEIGLWYCIGYIAQAEGLQTVAAGKSAFFNALAVVVVPILDVLFKRKILKKVEVASILIACIGVGLLELGPEGGLTISSGDILAFMQTIFFGVGYWRLEAESQMHSHHAARLTIGQLVAVAIGSTVYALTELGFGHLDTFSPVQIIELLGNPMIIGALFWTGLVSTALALYLETVALKVVSATELTLLMTTTSLWGAAFAFVALGEVLTPSGMVGGLLIMGGCILGNVSPQQPAKTMDDALIVLPILNGTQSDIRERS